MNIKALFAFAVVALVGMTTAEAEDHVSRELQVADSGQKLVDTLNAKRSEKGLATVCINSKLASAAQSLANDNAMSGKVSTTGSTGSTMTSRYDEAGIETTASAEAVAAGQSSADAVLATWSKGASGAYLFGDFKFIGPGYAYNKTQTYRHYWVLDFANAEGESCVTE